MGTRTTRRNFYKPTPPSETGWGQAVNTDNWDVLDRVGDAMNYRRVGATPDRWYAAGGISAAALVTVTPTANVLRAFPFIVPYMTTLDRIAINVTAAVAGNARLGIYADDGNCLPAERLLDAGEVSTATTGVKPLTISQAITAGTLLWLAHVGSAMPSLRAIPAGASIPILGYDATLGTDCGIGWSVAYTYAALPASWPGGAAVITVAAAQPAIFVRASA